MERVADNPGRKSVEDLVANKNESSEINDGIISSVVKSLPMLLGAAVGYSLKGVGLGGALMSVSAVAGMVLNRRRDYNPVANTIMKYGAIFAAGVALGSYGEAFN